MAERRQQQRITYYRIIYIMENHYIYNNNNNLYEYYIFYYQIKNHPPEQSIERWVAGSPGSPIQASGSKICSPSKAASTELGSKFASSL